MIFNPVIIQPSLDALKAEINANVDAKIAETQNLVSVENDATQSSLAGMSTGDDLNANTLNVNSHTTSKTNEIKSHVDTKLVDVAKASDIKAGRWVEAFGNGTLICWTSNSRAYFGSAAFSSAADQGTRYPITSDNIWRTVVNVTNKRGSYHGWISPYISAGRVLDVRVTCDGVVIEEKTYTAASVGEFYRYCMVDPIREETEIDHGSYVTISHAKKIHTAGAGTEFSDSLKIEMRIDVAFTSNVDLYYAYGFYYAEDKI